jgi:hypothetical protein
LIFGTKFDKEFKELPNSLTHLTLGMYYNKEIKENIFPLSLTNLSIKSSSTNKIIIPNTIKKLEIPAISSLLNNIPDFIEKLSIFFLCFPPLCGEITNIPSTVKEIIINYPNYVYLIKKIPFGCVIKDTKGNILKK